MEDILEAGISFLSLDAPSSLEKIVRLSSGKIIIEGNVPTTLFSDGSLKDMESAIRNCIDTAAEGSGYILASGCEVPGIAPPEKVDWFMEIVNELGKPE